MIDTAGCQCYLIVGSILLHKHDTPPPFSLILLANVKTQIYLRVAGVKRHRNNQHSDANKLRPDNTDQAPAFPMVKRKTLRHMRLQYFRVYFIGQHYRITLGGG